MIKFVEKNHKENIIGYDNYFLINKFKEKDNPSQQKDWININENKNLYFYLSEANNIDKAVKQIKTNNKIKT